MLLNQLANNKWTLRDVWDRIDIHSEYWRSVLRLYKYTWVIDFPQQWIWCMNFCSLLLLNHTSYHFLEHCTICLFILRNQRKRCVIQSSAQLYQNHNPTKRSNGINQTWSQFHPLLLPTHQGQWLQKQTINQSHKQCGGTPCICCVLVPGECMKLNSNGIGLDLSAQCNMVQ